MVMLANIGQYITFKRAFRRIAGVRAFCRRFRHFRIKHCIGKICVAFQVAFPSRYDPTLETVLSSRKDSLIGKVSSVGPVGCC